MRTRSLWTLLAALVAIPAFGQQLPRTASTITAAGADCSVAARCVTLNVGAAADSAGILVTGAWTATAVVEIAIDPAGTWTSQPETFNLASGAAGATITGNGYYVVPLRGAQAVRVRASAFTAGPITVTIGASPASGGVAITQPMPLPSGAATDRTTAAAPGSVRLSNGSSFITPTTPSDTQPISVVALPLPSGAATLAEQQTQTTALQAIDNLPIGQGSSTSGQSGVLTQGAVTSAAPSYTNGQTSPVSLTPAGAVRTDSSATTQPVVGNVAHDAADSGNPVKVGAKVMVDSGAASPTTPTYAGVGGRTDLWAERDGALVISNREMPRVDGTWDGSTPTALETAATGAPGTLTVDTTRAGCAIIWIRPTSGSSFTGGSVVFEMTANGGTSWEALSGSNGDTTYTTSPLFPATTFNNGAEAGWRFPVQAVDMVRVRLATAITGSGGSGAAGSPTFAIGGRATASPCAPFGIARQGDPTRLHMTAHGAVANDVPEDPADAPLKMGGTAYQASGEPINPLSNLPNVSASADRGTILLSPYNEQRVVTSDKLKIATISAAVAGTGSPNTIACSPATGCAGPVPLEGMGSLVVDIPTQTYTATLTFEQSIDSVNWVSAAGIETRLYTYGVSFGTSCAGSCGGTWQFILQQGYRYFRVRATALSSAVTVVISATAQTGIFGLSFIEGDVAHGGNDVATRPVKTGGKVATGVPTPVADGSRVNSTYDAYGLAFVRQDHPNRFSCGADNIGAALTALSASCADAAVTSTQSLYITGIVASSTTATGGQFILRSGTGAACGTGTTSVLPSAATVARLAAPGNTVAPLTITLQTPIKVTADHGLCVLGVATNTVTIQVVGFIAP